MKTTETHQSQNVCLYAAQASPYLEANTFATHDAKKDSGLTRVKVHSIWH